MKKKILAMSLVAVLAAVAMISGTLAYFTDTDEADNTFTTANVEIELLEKQRDGEGALEEFENDKVLLPIVGSAQGEKDEHGLPVAANYVDKIITVKNLAIDAYVRVYIAIPTVLDSVGDSSQNIIHFTIPDNDFVGVDGTTAADSVKWGIEIFVGTVIIDDVSYNVYSRTYTEVLEKNMIAGSAAYVGFYLDAGVDYNNESGKYTIARNSETSDIEFDFVEGITIPVYTVGVQAAGFDNADTAIDTAFGAGFNPWVE